MLYFGYASNLHQEDLARWLAAQGHGPAETRVVGPAWLPDTEPVFHYWSEARGGGALDIRARRGSALPGVLFHVSDAALALLDEKEGRGNYHRVERIAITRDGDEARCTVFTVLPERRREAHVPPPAEYLRVVREGLAAHGLPDAHVVAAATRLEIPPFPRSLFVYGTLLFGESQHATIASARPLRISPARVAGRLVDLGEYPGLVRSERSSDTVAGELVELDDPASLLDALDTYEGFEGWGASDPLFRRVVVETHDGAGVCTHAWAYSYTRTDGVSFGSDDWRTRRR